MTDEQTGEAGTNGASQNELPRAVTPQGRTRRMKPWQRRLLIVLGLILAMIAGLVLPPLVNISRYQRRITEIVSRSFGRPVHLSGVELRLLPLPGFVIHDLSVAEDPAFGAEPVLSARTVIANVRLLALWRGRIEVDRIAVDEASLNVVHSGDGHWNLEALMMGPAEPALTGKPLTQPDSLGAARARQRRFPYLRATNTRINLKSGLVKSPFSLVNSDLSLWQDQPGEWRLRLTGQPFRTDTEMSFQADNGTGDVRIEGTLHSAPSLREMPLKLDMEWRDAQLGQLSRLILGSDAGWRGDIVADVQVEGVSESLKAKGRLRATGVRRAEFAPETPLDLDANCSFVYQHSINAFHQLGCDTAIGNGHLILKAEVPRGVSPTSGSLDVKDLPVQASLDLLRTLRSDFAPGMNARGSVNGRLTYQQQIGAAPPIKPVHQGFHHKAQAEAPAPAALQGSLTVEGTELRGGQLKEPLIFPKMIWTPTIVAASGSAPKMAIGAKVTIPLAAATPAATPQASSSEGTTPPTAPLSAQSIALRVGLSLKGYDTSVSGTATLARMRELAYAFGLTPLDAADGFAAGTADFDLTASGPWIASGTAADRPALAVSETAAPEVSELSDSLLGTIQFHHTEWQAPYLRRPIELAQGILTLAPASISLASDFTYGTIAGAIMVVSPGRCHASDCSPQPNQISLRFGSIDAGVLQTAFLGAPEHKTLLSPLMDRMRSNEKPAWPPVSLTVTADALALGPVTLRKVSAGLHFADGKVVIDRLDAGLLGGSTHLTGDFVANAAQVDYSLQGSFSQIAAAQAGQLVAASWSGQPISGSGSLTLSGVNATDLAASAKGELHFAWKHGSVSAATPQLSHFEQWSGTATIAPGKLELGENQLVSGGKINTVQGTIPFGGPAKFAINVPASRN